MQRNGKMQRGILNTDRLPHLASATMTERAEFFFSGPGCVCTRAWQVDTLKCLSFVDPSAFSSRVLLRTGAVHVRGGVIKF